MSVEHEYSVSTILSHYAVQTTMPFTDVSRSFQSQPHRGEQSACVVADVF